MLLPYLNPHLGGILGVIDPQSVSEDPFQAVHELGGQHDFGQQVEDLFVLLQCLVYEVDIYLRLAAGSHAMEQHHVVLLPLGVYLV